ncbi:hypothetical protein CEXT_798901 [Caerostris extrusa]|uniref:Uncharacterized protein n=1 Tax=Caerostris extrusa TaxID=172846 RepID=A0AAV4UF45_CAEEX|nr:hypothetical protein CEXT_798901 [Caerostris extrusa]
MVAKAANTSIPKLSYSLVSRFNGPCQQTSIEADVTSFGSIGVPVMRIFSGILFFLMVSAREPSPQSYCRRCVIDSRRSRFFWSERRKKKKKENGIPEKSASEIEYIPSKEGVTACQKGRLPLLDFF